LSPYCYWVICVCVSYVSTPLAQAHVAKLAVNLGDTSFLEARGGPGLLVEEIGGNPHQQNSRPIRADHAHYANHKQHETA
jgi:hypothetical protein